LERGTTEMKGKGKTEGRFDERQIFEQGKAFRKRKTRKKNHKKIKNSS
jgi:hypothetical protein